MSKIATIPQGISGFGAGLVLGFVADRVVEYIYVNYGGSEVETPLFPLDDWFVLVAIPFLLIMLKKYAFAGGWVYGALIGSAWLR